MPLATRLISSKLVNKFGFEEHQTHHNRYQLRIDGQLVAWTKLSHGHREESDQMLAVIARQLGVSRRDLYDMVECRLDRDNYVHRVTS